MQKLVTTYENVTEYHAVSVPSTIKLAKIEILTFLGAPAFLGTKLAKLHFGNNQSIVLYSKMSGVVNSILVHNNQTVSGGERLFELRNANTTRTKGGHKMHPSSLPAPRPVGNIFRAKKKNSHTDCHTASVFNAIKLAEVEILASPGAPGFFGTKLAKLHFDNNQSTPLCSKMSGVINSNLVKNNQTVSYGEQFFRLKNTNILSIKAGQKMSSFKLPVPKSFNNFFCTKKENSQDESYLLPTSTPVPLRNKP